MVVTWVNLMDLLKLQEKNEKIKSWELLAITPKIWQKMQLNLNLIILLLDRFLNQSLSQLQKMQISTFYIGQKRILKSQLS